MTGAPLPALLPFAALFGVAPAVEASAHGRVNLIGEHTDYNAGFVLPTLIPQSTRVEVAARRGAGVRVFSTRMPDRGIVSFTIGDERRTGTWIDYVQGITFVLRRAGFDIAGFDARIDSDVPLGSGLSSSAALEVALLRALRQAFALALDDVRLARLGQEAENDLVGAPVGIMDQMCASLADQHSALLLDCRSLDCDRVPLPTTADIVVVNSGVAHRLAAGDSGYATRRQQCETAAHLLHVGALRDLTAHDLPRVMDLPEPLGRRVRHVVTENARVLETADALRGGDVAAVGRLFAASHTSMRDDYAVSTPAVDLLVAIAAADDDVYGARLTGGGFGGAIVALTRAGTGRVAGERVARAYAARSGQVPTVLVPAT